MVAQSGVPTGGGHADVEPALAVLRAALCCAVVSLLLVCRVFSSFYTDAGFLYRSHPLLPKRALGAAGFRRLKLLVLVSSILYGIGFLLPLTGALFCCSFAVLNFYATRFSTDYWITNTHLNIFSFLVYFSGGGRGHSVDSLFGVPGWHAASVASLSFLVMRLYVVLVYFQAGISKVLAGGSDWFLTGQSLRVAVGIHGTRRGRQLLATPGRRTCAAVATGVFELLAPVALVSRTVFICFLAIALVFHFATWLTLGISFWFLWILYPGLLLGARWHDGAGPGRQVWILVALAAVMLAHTLLRGSHWPISCHDLFADLFPMELDYYAVVLVDAAGDEQFALPGAVVPIEYFRTANLIGNVFLRGSDRGVRDALAKSVLGWANGCRWPRGGEIMHPVRRNPQIPFVGVRIALYRFDFRRLQPSQQLDSCGSLVRDLHVYGGVPGAAEEIGA
ncbi:HTTM domain-containing protein [Actinacidiphila yeochonensis]|uniref:HTTM domain-containing protein n=1 Tax=Actinacidiphila yeochonensis TaxID=89050 RepID=UPI00055D81A1|nr:HTTM domain-containing protein [Actinacidiphila yeochonensis]